MSAVFGVSTITDEAAGTAYNALLSLQHRGQEGAGVAVVRDRKIICHKNSGQVAEVFSGTPLISLRHARTAIGHALYSKTGTLGAGETGPYVTEYLTGRVVLALNGSITNAFEVREELLRQGLLFQTNSDGELVSSLIAFHSAQEGDVLSGVAVSCAHLKGAYSLAVADGEGRLIAARDPAGYRPLCVGINETGTAVASESCALEVCGFEPVRDVLPGEIIAIQDGRITKEGVVVEPLRQEQGQGLCIFEYVYFSRPDSVVDGLCAHEARFNMGCILAEEYPVSADIVCGVPDTGLEAAYGYHARSGIPLVTGFVKNRYVGRSFIYSSQSERENVVRIKLNPLTANVRGKRIVVIDDSIVRGTTTAYMLKNLRSAGAVEVHMRICSPPYRYVCDYGTAVANDADLIANRYDVDGIRRSIGADSLGFISLKGLKNACWKSARGFCTACFARA
jgi:amidophosphoribosyltransferase